MTKLDSINFFHYLSHQPCQLLLNGGTMCVNFQFQTSTLTCGTDNNSIDSILLIEFAEGGNYKLVCAWAI